MVWYSHLFKSFPQFVVIHTVKGFRVVNEAEIDVFLEFPSFFYDPTDVDNLVSGSSAFSKFSLYNCMLSVHILLKPSLKDSDHYLASIYGPDIPGSYAILLFTASGLASITSHIHRWVSFWLWHHPFVLSVVISPLISSSRGATFSKFLIQFSVEGWGCVPSL